MIGEKISSYVIFCIQYNKFLLVIEADKNICFIDD